SSRTLGVRRGRTGHGCPVRNLVRLVRDPVALSCAGGVKSGRRRQDHPYGRPRAVPRPWAGSARGARTRMSRRGRPDPLDEGPRVAQQVAILAAGMGTRLGQPFPKALTPLRDGRTIMGQQLDNVHAVFPDAQVLVVVGFKLEMILEAHPRSLYVYNEE